METVILMFFGFFIGIMLGYVYGTVRSLNILKEKLGKR